NNYVNSQSYLGRDAVTSGGNFPAVVPNNGTVVFQAGQFIRLLDGFHAQAGASFTAKIDICGPTVSLQSTAAQTRQTTTQPTLTASLQIAPNPSQEDTRLSFALPKKLRTSLVIYNQNGQLAKTLINAEEMNRGINEILLPRAELVPGMYFVQLRTPLFQETKKLVIIQ
ncbi:MAG: T9SS type A sorting domain-containing protein, partial [Bacteroidota bacterium]